MSENGSQTSDSSRSRKESAQHRSAQMTLHFHNDGEICPSSFGLICPLGDVYDDQPIPGALPPGIVPRLPNGLSFQSLLGGGSGFNPAMAMAMGMGMGDGGGDMNMMMASMLSAMSSGVPGMDSLDPFGSGGLDMSSLAAGLSSVDGGMSSMGAAGFGNPAMAMMAAMASGSGGSFGGGNPAMAMMAAMAAASQGGGAGGIPGAPGGNPMAMMAAMAAAQSAVKTTDSSGNPVPPAVVAARFKAAVQQAQTNVAIAQTVANSSLAKMSDDQTRTATEGQFFTTKEFVNFMSSATTEVGSVRFPVRYSNDPLS